MRTEFLLCVCSPVVIIVYFVTKDVTKQSADSPETYRGGEGWDDWITWFENVVMVNGWDAEAKLNWIKECLAGRAQKAFQS